MQRRPQMSRRPSAGGKSTRPMPVKPPQHDPRKVVARKRPPRPQGR